MALDFSVINANSNAANKAIGFDADLVLAPFFTGNQVSGLAYGALVAMSLAYYTRFGRDEPLINLCWVAAVNVFPLLLWIANWGMFWPRVVEAHSVFQFLEVAWPVRLIIIAVTFGVAVPQCFFAYRLWKLSRRRIMVAAILVLAITAPVFAVIIMAIGDGLPPLPGQSSPPGIATVQAWGEIDFWLSWSADLLLVGNLSHYFITNRRGFNDTTDTILAKLLRLTLGNAAVTVPLQLAIVISIRTNADRVNTVASAFELLVPMVYSICVVYSLSSRDELLAIANRGHTYASGSGPIGGQTATIGSPVASRHGGGGRPDTAKSFNITTERAVRVDFDDQLHAIPEKRFTTAAPSDDDLELQAVEKASV